MPAKWDPRDYVGKTIGIYECLECLNPGEKHTKIKYRVRCTKCGAESTILRISLKGYISKGSPEQCKNCKDTHLMFDFQEGKVYGKYKILKYLGLRKNSTRFYKVKCIKCGWKGEVSTATIQTELKRPAETCKHNKFNLLKYPIGTILNQGRYTVWGYLYNPKGVKKKEIKYIVRCSGCGKLIYMACDKLNVFRKNPYCNHRSYFNPDEYIKGVDYITEMPSIETEEFVEQEKEEKSMNKFTLYVLKKNEDIIRKSVVDIITHDPEFLTMISVNANNYLAEKLETSLDEDLDECIKNALTTKEFKNALLAPVTSAEANKVKYIAEKAAQATAAGVDLAEEAKKKKIVKTAPKKYESKKVEADVLKSITSAGVNKEAPVFELADDKEYNEFVKILKVYKLAPMNKNKNTFPKNEIIKLIGKGNVSRIMEKSMKKGVLMPAGVVGNVQMYYINTDI